MTETLKVKTRGSGADLVLVHGWGMHSGIWGSAADALAREYRLHLVDLPGHGINRHIPLPRDLAQVTELIMPAVPPAAWMGWSLGGLIALSAALRHSERVKKLVLVGATPSFSRQPDWDCGVGEDARRTFASGLESDFENTLEQFFLQTFGPKWSGEALRRLGGQSPALTVPGKQNLLAGLELLYGNNLIPVLNRCKMPALYLGGTRDRTVRPESFERAAGLMPNAEAALIRGAGHAPFITHEDTFLEITGGFLA
jgi:pimeloyl-[acyl-carrier protein] methyl ester esterase